VDHWVYLKKAPHLLKNPNFHQQPGVGVREKHFDDERAGPQNASCAPLPAQTTDCLSDKLNNTRTKLAIDAQFCVGQTAQTVETKRKINSSFHKNKLNTGMVYQSEKTS